MAGVLLVCFLILRTGVYGQNCRMFQYTCDNGDCVHRGTLTSTRCDGTSQCSDGSDEKNCDDCRSGYGCKNGGCTVFVTDRCNGVNDCLDGSDEDNCGLAPDILNVIIGAVVGVFGMVVVVPSFICVICCICCCFGEPPPPPSRRDSKSIGRSITQISSSAFLAIPSSKPFRKLSSGSSFPQEFPFFDTATTYPQHGADLAKEVGGRSVQPPEDCKPPPLSGTHGGNQIPTLSKCQPPAGDQREETHSFEETYQNPEMWFVFETPV